MISKTVYSFLVGLLCALLLCSIGKASPIPADSDKAAASEIHESCTDLQPCGWAIYDKVTRQVNFFMKNRCECSQDKTCMKAEEDISISAFLYRCKPK